MTEVETFGCVKTSIRLRSGLYLDLADPQPDQFTFSDIAGALSKLCRFGGQINNFYSVAEHLVLCADIAAGDGLSRETQAAVLMHDAAEAFCGDVVRPLKVMLDDYRPVERRMQNVIGEKFGIDFDRHHDDIRKIDNEMVLAERRHLFSRDSVVWDGEESVRRLKIAPRCWAWDIAECMFVRRAMEAGLVTEFARCGMKGGAR